MFKIGGRKYLEESQIMLTMTQSSTSDISYLPPISPPSSLFPLHFIPNKTDP